MFRVKYSVVILTFNRNHLLETLLRELVWLADQGVEIIVVDNCSEHPAEEVVKKFGWVRLFRSPENIGAAGRNIGIENALGEIVICLDDDISQLPRDVCISLDSLFLDADVAAVNFRVIEDGTGRVVNWVHHRPLKDFENRAFDTYEITEGAVALRAQITKEVGGYPASFFISHEGPDLALRLMDQGLRVTYTPSITVTHSFAPEGRPSWRRYYFDSRNVIWLAIRNLPLGYGLKVVALQVAAMGLDAIRDGYVVWWLKGVFDGCRFARREMTSRRCVSSATMNRIRGLDRYRPSFVKQVKRRILREMG